MAIAPPRKYTGIVQKETPGDDILAARMVTVFRLLPRVLRDAKFAADQGIHASQSSDGVGLRELPGTASDSLQIKDLLRHDSLMALHHVMAIESRYLLLS
jgi:hypothetical protein